MADLALALLGTRPTSKGRTEWRWGKRGSLAIVVTGPKRGCWFDFEAGIGGHALDLIMHLRRCEFRAAIEFGRHLLGQAAPPPPPPRCVNGHHFDDKGAAAVRGYRLAVSVTAKPDCAAAVYLRDFRKIPPLPPAIADLLHFEERSPIGPCLTAPLTTADGTLQATHRISLSKDGTPRLRPDGRKLKLSYGAQHGAWVRIPGDPAGPLLIGEGLETTLACAVSTGYEAWAACGSITRLTPSTGRCIIILADDDAESSPAERARLEAVSRWRKAGCYVRITYPWPERRYDKSDCADVIAQFGPDAVRERIAAVLPSRRLPRDAAEAELREAVTNFIVAAQNCRSDDPEPPTHAINASLGLGKSREIRIQTADLIHELRQQLPWDKRDKCNKPTAAILVPLHALSREAEAELRDLPEAQGLSIGTWRGRQAQNPDKPDEKMCRNLAEVQDAQASLLNADDAVCPDCPHRHSCAYLAQKGQHADITLGTHDLLVHRKPVAFGKLRAVIIDENPVSKFLTGLGPRKFWTLLELDTLHQHYKLTDDAYGTDAQTLATLHRQAAEFIERSDTTGPLSREQVPPNFTHETINKAIELEWRTKISPRFHEGMDAAERRSCIRAARINKTLLARVYFWRAIGSLLANDPEAKSGNASIEIIEDDETGTSRRAIRLKGKREVNPSWKAPTLIADATLQPDLLRLIWPNIHLAADIQAEEPHQHIRQVIDRSFAVSQLDIDDEKAPEKRIKTRRRNLRDAHAILVRLACAYAPRPVLIIAQKRIVPHLLEMHLPGNVAIASQNGIRGRDAWTTIDGRTIRGIEFAAGILLGRTLPSNFATRDIAEALTGTAIPTAEYLDTHIERELTDGSTAVATVKRAAHPIMEAARWGACDAEAIQDVGRGRGARRTAANPIDWYVLSDVALPWPVEPLRYEDIRPTPDDLMFASGGISLESPASMAAAYPDLWQSQAAAQKVRQRGISRTFSYKYVHIGDCPRNQGQELPPFLDWYVQSNTVLASFRLTGRGRQIERAAFDPARIPDPESWLREHVAKPRGADLDWFRIARLNPEEPAAPDPEVPPGPDVEPDVPARTDDLPDTPANGPCALDQPLQLGADVHLGTAAPVPMLHRDPGRAVVVTPSALPLQNACLPALEAVRDGGIVREDE